MSEDRPLITFMLVAYNQERFIAEAVQGAFSQTYSPLEIILSDDSSSDRTFTIMQEMALDYKGPHTIVYTRNKRNLGLAEHINCVMEIVKGELVVVAAGDDISFPQRVDRVYEIYMKSNKQAKALFSNAVIINAAGQEQKLYFEPNSKVKESLTAEIMAKKMRGVLGCTQVWSPATFTFFGPLSPDIYQEDLIIPFRASLLGEVLYIDEALVQYRVHETNMHFRSADDKQNRSLLHAALLRQAQNQIAICRDRIHALETMIEAVPSQQQHWEILIKSVNHRLDLATAESRLYAPNNFSHRLRIIFSAWQDYRPSVRVLVRWVLTSLPFLYLWYIRCAKSTT